MIKEAILNRLVERLAVALAPPRVPLCRFVADGALIGEIEQARVARLTAFDKVFVHAAGEIRFVPSLNDCASRTAALDDVVRTLGADGALSAWRDERYAAAAAFDAPPCFLIERAAARYFGIATFAVHVNGLGRLADGRDAMWLGRRSPAKAIDPGLLDNMIAGGVSAGSDVRATLRKEAWEEAGLASALSDAARYAGELRIRRLQPDGVQRETVFVHDLAMPDDVAPVNQDGEVVAFRLSDADEVAEFIGNARGPDVVTADASLVIADWLLRAGHVPAGVTARRLDALRRARPDQR